MTSPQLHVTDGTATLFRAYFGMNAFRSPDGREMGGVLGFCQAIVRFIRTVNPSHVAMVFDSPERTHRHLVYPDYKANRKAPPPDMEPQFEASYEAARALGLATFRIPGYEADDLMATFAHRAVAAGVPITLLSPDKDVLQLMRPGVDVMDPKDFRRLSAADVLARLGVPPERALDLQALAGDPGDNVPGVAGIGQKSAAAVVQACGDLEAIYADLGQIERLPIRGARSIARKLAEGRTDAFRFRELLRLQTEAPLAANALTLADLRYQGPSPEADAFFDRLGFHAPLRALRGS